ncbi:hypothetical protein [Lentzea sp. NPDC004782]|uniref:hypothetical protein n=1 Tax=Lentzea sp. NPDC004782 TaxID=3154458 RepID=UPI0033ABD5E5
MTSSSFQNGCFFFAFFLENLGSGSSSYEEEEDEEEEDEYREEDVENRDVGSAGPSPEGGVVSQVDEESSFTR